MPKVIFGIPPKIDCSKLPKRTRQIIFSVDDYAVADHPDEDGWMRRFYPSGSPAGRNGERP